MPRRYYTGIGSRETPLDVCDEMAWIAKWLRSKRYRLRSGHAIRADQAFEWGAEGSADIYLPWSGFEGSTSLLALDKLPAGAVRMAEEMARKHHPAWDRCGRDARAFHTRNTFQILGFEGLSEFVVCWTKDGKASGGTGQALRLAKHFKIPIVNMYHYPTERKVKQRLGELIPYLSEYQGSRIGD